jgi:hypothetical protein
MIDKITVTARTYDPHNHNIYTAWLSVTHAFIHAGGNPHLKRRTKTRHKDTDNFLVESGF